jgi:outer membrane protein TolC
MCALLVAHPLLAQSGARVSPPPQNFGGWFSNNYRPATIAPINLANSNRLEMLLRGGNLYLSLADAVALAIENNLDVELQRYGPEIARAGLLRAEAGGLLRGQQLAVQQGPTSAANQVLGTAGGGAGGLGLNLGGGGGDGAQTATGGTVIAATGTALPSLDPVFTSNMSWGHSTQPLSNTITSGGLTAVTFNSTSFNNSISKGWLLGTNSTFSWNMQKQLSNNPAQDLNASKNGSFQLQVQQPLLQGFGVAVNNRNIRVARNSLRTADLQFRLQLITTVAAIENLYWDLVSYNADVEVRRQAVGLAQRLVNNNRTQVEIGTLAPIEVVSAEAAMAAREQELVASETALLQQETIIKSALSRTGVLSPSLAEARVIPTDSIQVPAVDSIRPVQDLYGEALQSRPDLAQTQINLESSRIGLDGSRSQLKPSLNVFGSLTNNALAGEISALPALPGRGRSVDPFFIGGYGTVLSQLFRRNFPNYTVGFQFNIPIRNRQAQADMITDSLNVRQAEINQQRQLNQLRVDVQNAVIAVRQARARLDAAVKQRDLQQQTLDAEQRKLELGATTAFFVIQYQTDLAAAQSSEVAARANYAKSRVDMDRVLGRTLEAHNIEVDEAMSGRISRVSTLPPGVQ